MGENNSQNALLKALDIKTISDNGYADRSKQTNATGNVSVEDEHDYTGHLVRSLKWIGMLHMFPGSKKWYLKLLGWAYMMFVDFVSFHLSVLSLVYLCIHMDADLISVVFMMINIIIYVASDIFILYFQLYSAEFMALAQDLNQSFKHQSAPGLTRLDMSKAFENARSWSISFQIVCVVGAIHWAVMPIFTKSEDGCHLFPLKAWYPFDEQQSPNYEMVYFLQFFGQFMVALVYANFGGFFMTFCFLICGQFDVLSCSLRNIRFTVLLRSGISVNDLVRLSGCNLRGSKRCTLPEDEENEYFSGKAEVMDKRLIVNNFVDQKQESTIHGERDEQPTLETMELQDTITMAVIKECIQHHQLLLNYCARVKKFASTISFCKMLEVTLLICVILYSSSVFFYLPLMEYAVITLLDLFLVCYMGNEVSIRSTRVSMATLSGPWHTLSPRARRELIPLLVRANRPVRFTGGSFYILNLENCIGVLKASFSYITLLRSMSAE